MTTTCSPFDSVKLSALNCRSPAACAPAGTTSSKSATSFDSIRLVIFPPRSRPGHSPSTARIPEHARLPLALDRGNTGHARRQAAAGSGHRAVKLLCLLGGIDHAIGRRDRIAGAAPEQECVDEARIDGLRLARLLGDRLADIGRRIGGARLTQQLILSGTSLLGGRRQSRLLFAGAEDALLRLIRGRHLL